MNKTILAFLLSACLGAAAISVAATRTDNLADQFKLNQASPNAMAQTLLGTKVIQGAERKMRAYWDYSVQGGAISTITLKNADTGENAVLPKGAIVRDCLFDVVTAPSPLTSPSPTLAFGTGQAANDLKAALDGGQYTGLVACVPVGTAATAIKLTADRTMTMTIAGQAVTRGKVYVIVQYELSDTL